ncbi:TetR/AcrR family transcriptional regulator [Anaerosinus massiliensis]|uniref:TetR/AcrR family transcriptional regulator n=1 Tax=Massilibacillus massiliensis TaxID=1806837 RepID=UPI0018FE8CB2|nr:TetR/AcrR family transcriptional regulator [Massilibacillus massiliensis]
MDAAQGLFLSIGYLQTTVQDIVRKVNVAQGTFYYYYNSKESILEAITIRHINKTIEKMQSTELINATALDKLTLFINLFYYLCHKDIVGQISDVLYKEKQGILINKLWRLTLTATSPILISILEQCNQEGVSKVTRMEESLAFFNGIMAALLESSSPTTYGHETDIQIIKSKVHIAERLFENLFQLPEGSLRLKAFWSEEE